MGRMFMWWAILSIRMAILWLRYWKNGVLNQLTSGVSFAWDIFVSGNDVYTTGSIRNTGPGIGFVSYWKNNTATLLSPGLDGGAGRDVVVVGNDVYVAGIERNVKHIGVAKYWKNGAPVALSDGAFEAQANAIDCPWEKTCTWLDLNTTQREFLSPNSGKMVYPFRLPMAVILRTANAIVVR